ncbi:E3 ubiquitin-protein ligase TRIM56-like [Pecten maximus]|uniref:E3 ubiquitin-protein ligase TRIM56-like n=1 Tax=Pecten maximus TaxID=6579 RepID=UPI001458E752|nr:E3 ubiquitin-protein ligase TRIM56-like [Pecten maximus]
MADIDDSIDDTSFRCLLCFQPYDCPRELPCLHTFCRRCFDSFTQTELTTNRTFPCPICEKPTPLSCPKSPVSTWASFLPHGLTHQLSPSVTQAGDGDVVCEGCRRDDENTRATHWCRHCVEALCSSCKIAHRRNKKTNDHKVVEISAVRNPGSSVLPLSVPERCPQHPGKTLEVYCIDHHTLCCILCLAVSHRQCSHVRSIEDVSREPMSTCDDTWIRIEAESKVLLQKYEEAISSLDLDKENAIASMIAKLDAVRKKIDELQMK